MRTKCRIPSSPFSVVVFAVACRRRPLSLLAVLAVVLVGEEESVWEWSVTMRAGGEEHACRHIGFPVWRAGSVCHRVSQSGPPDFVGLPIWWLVLWLRDPDRQTFAVQGWMSGSQIFLVMHICLSGVVSVPPAAGGIAP